jgi:hypothetical protein
MCQQFGQSRLVLPKRTEKSVVKIRGETAASLCGSETPLYIAVKRHAPFQGF